tara:strand:- start:1010 stop:2380 length:1371 start_codon:yes stop_codon:yes gene_type:complete
MKEKKVKIGLEVHIQLNTKTKLFCGCRTDVKEPNSAVCEICLGMPGSKPSLNIEAVKKGISLALALDSKIQDKMVFSRKTYFYPDMSKNYQITQYEFPLAFGGSFELQSKKIRITRLQLEEDPASIQHKGTYSLLDYNRSGIPLIELVTEPDFSSIKEVKEFIKEVISILDYLNIYDPSKFSIRVDTNVNIEGHPRVEIKNLNSLKTIEKAVNFEIIRQKNNLKNGTELKQKTVYYDEATGSIIASREKETEEDYGYIFDTDLPVFTAHTLLVKSEREKLPELPKQKINRLVKEYNITKEESKTICIEKFTADIFEKAELDKKRLAKWICGSLRKVLNYNKLKLSQTKINKLEIEKLFGKEDEKILTPRTSELVLRRLAVESKDVDRIIYELGFGKVTDEDLKILVKEVVKKHKKAVDDYKAGKNKSFQFLIGKIVKLSKGCADAKKAKKILKEII